MKVNGQSYRTIWIHEENPQVVMIIDQRYLPHQFVIREIDSLQKMATAIKDMQVRGAGLIGVAAGYGMYLATLQAPDDQHLEEYLNRCGEELKATRPTAVNLSWAVNLQINAMKQVSTLKEKQIVALQTAQQLSDEDANFCRSIGIHGMEIIKAISHQKNGASVNILTHCNAGWLAFTDYGSATAPIYAAAEQGINLHVWVDETRPRNQGASLTAWELGMQGIPHTVIADNTGGHLMQHSMVDLVIVGSDRTTVTGDVANKIGTYLKALAAKDNAIPFYVALPSSSFDWMIEDGIKEIKIEERDEDEVKYMEGLCEGEIKKVRVAPENSPAKNYGFDVTPARLVTGIITERGICQANKESILQLFPEKK